MKTLDIYLRRSIRSDERMLSIRGQEAHCRDRLRDYGAGLGAVLADDGKSAWDRRVRRPAWEELMRRLESGESDGVCVYDLSRFTRRPVEGERLIGAAERGLAVIDSEAAYDLATPDGKAAFRDQMKMAAYLSDRTSKNTRRGKKLRAEGGELNIAARPFGFDVGEKGQPWSPVIRADEAAVIREWAERLLKGESQEAIIREANAAGILTSRGGPWKRAGFRQVMTRPINAGLVTHHGEVVAEFPAAILDRVTHDRVVALFESRKRGRPISGRYLLSGKEVTRCGLCGNGLTGRPRNNRKPYPDGEVRREYWCSNGAGGCGRVTVDARALENYAADMAISALASPRHAEAIARREAERAAVREPLLAESASIETTLESLSAKLAAALPAAVRNGRAETVLSRHEAVTEPLEKRLAEISAELERIGPVLVAEETPHRTVPAKDQDYLYWLERWTGGIPGERRAMLLRALDGKVITVHPGRNVEDRVTIA